VTNFYGFVINEDDRALIKAPCQEKTEVHDLCWGTFRKRIGPGQAWTGCWGKLIPLAWQSVRKAVAVRDQFALSNFRKHRTSGWAHLQS